MITYNNIINSFRSFCENHKQLKDFYSGEVYDFQSRNNIYPNMLITPDVSTIENGRFLYTFNIFITDLLNDDLSNQDEIYSDCSSICGDIYSEFYDNYENYGFTINENIDLNKVNEELIDNISGWMMTVNIQVPFYGSDCNLPVDYFFTNRTQIVDNYYTKIECDNKFLTGVTFDLSNYYTTAQTYTKDEVDNLLTGGTTDVWERGLGTLSVQTVDTGCVASGDKAIAYGEETIASGVASHSEGFENYALGDYSHVEGTSNVARVTATHAEGAENNANGNYSHAEGYSNTTIGISSHAEGYSVTAHDFAEHVGGTLNIIGTGSTDTWVATDNLFTLGNGIDDANRSNAFQVKKNGDVSFSGVLTGNGSGLTGVNPITVVNFLLESASWSAKTQTINVRGVTTTNEIWWDASTLADSILAGQANIFCSAQGADSLTFVCNTTPSSDINIKVKITGTI